MNNPTRLTVLLAGWIKAVLDLAIALDEWQSKNVFGLMAYLSRQVRWSEMK
jgi:hypothetical protein